MINDNIKLTIALAINQMLTKLTVITSKIVNKMITINHAIHIFSPPTLIIRDKI